MKVTKAQLRKIIAEEYQKLQEGNEVSRMIVDLEMIGQLVNDAAKYAQDPETVERLERADQIVTSLFEKMHGLLSRD